VVGLLGQFAAGVAAGTLGGLLGIGGGVILMPLLRFVLALPPAQAAGTCIIAVFFTTLGGSYRHHRLGHLRPSSIISIIIPGVLASAAFSLLFSYLAQRGHWIDLGVGLVFALISVRMIVEGVGTIGTPQLEGSTAVEGPLPIKLAVGTAAGALPGLLGIGTGGILVPAFTFLLRTPVRTAMAASLTCFCFNALVSAVIKAAQGFVAPEVALPLCLGTLIGANLGSLLNRRFASAALKLLFGALFTYVSLGFVSSFIGSYS
jgi:uncharacterized membrane protein YfcA